MRLSILICMHLFFTPFTRVKVLKVIIIKDAPSNDIDSSLINTNESKLTHFLLFGKASLDISANTLIFNAFINSIIEQI